jgi:hypothetical protein
VRVEVAPPIFEPTRQLKDPGQSVTREIVSVQDAAVVPAGCEGRDAGGMGKGRGGFVGPNPFSLVTRPPDCYIITPCRD